jgi:hypothetical protein
MFTRIFSFLFLVTVAIGGAVVIDSVTVKSWNGGFGIVLIIFWIAFFVVWAISCLFQTKGGNRFIK